MDCFFHLLEYIQNLVQLVWSEEVESSSVLRSISVVVDADSNDCADNDEINNEAEAANVDEEKNESTAGEEFDFLSLTSTYN